MSDQELIQALRVCARRNCKECPQNGKYPHSSPSCMDDMLRGTADKIANQNTHILALQKEIEGLRAQLPRWIPVTERLPEPPEVEE